MKAGYRHGNLLSVLDQFDKTYYVQLLGNENGHIAGVTSSQVSSP